MFQEFIKKYPSVFKIPLVALQDLELMNKLDSMIKELLTQQCGSMKQKIVTSTDRGSNIHALCRSLSGNCTEITSAHWSCHSSLIQFRTVVAESAKSQEEVTSNSNHENVPADMEGDDADSSPSAITQCTWTFNQYWSYIDVLLGELRDDTKKNTSTTQAAEEFIKQFFTEVLQADLRKYPSTTSLAPSLDSVTVDWQKTIHSKLIW
ncbi:hypothetical protein DFH29DRAFT_795172 [Suillus ampliporus]|nr:hypothetical protein DFH29DRAFT_795172 [Suillus ampliporus]